MIPDLSPIFSRYLTLRAETDALFARVRSAFPDCVLCKQGCDDCCHALFDLSLVEAMYLNKVFQNTMEYGPKRSAILTRASEIDRKLTKLKRDLFQQEKNGTTKEELLRKAAQLRMPCPLLDEDKTCLLYEERPITCRLYGIPTDFGGASHVCGLSGFAQGQSYPTVHLEAIQARLEGLCRDMATTLKSRFTELDQVYVPISMALLTRYDETYLGLKAPKED